MRLTNKIRGAAMAALTATALAAWAPPALATGPDGDAVDAAEIAAEAVAIAVGPEAGDVSFSSNSTGDGPLVADTGATRVVAPADSGEPIIVGTGEGDVLDIGISLPVTASASDAEVVDGDTVYVDKESDTSFVVDAHDDGARIISVLDSPRASHEISYALDLPDEVTPTINSDGGVDLIVESDSGGSLSLGGFAPPWAVDAAGETQETRYEVRAKRLVQVVMPSPEAVYPLAADPSYYVCTPGGVSVVLCSKLTRSETTSTANAVAQLSSVAAAAYFAEAICGKLPDRVTLRGVRLNPKALCKTVAAVWAANMVANLRSAAGTPGKCLEGRLFTFVGLPIGALDPFAVRNC